MPMAPTGNDLYNDGRIICNESGLVICWYYLWGAKTIPYSRIASVTELPLAGLNAVSRWRIWGSGDFVHWLNLDPSRPQKRLALVLEVGNRILPTITPDDPRAVADILRHHASLA